MRGRPIPECSMVNWLFDIVWNLLGLIRESAVFDAVNLLTDLYKLDNAS